MAPKTEVQPEVGTEEKTSVQPPSAEVKSSAGNAGFPHKPEEKTSVSGSRKKRYDGSGRRNTDEEIDEILDNYLRFGILPHDVSERQRRDYKKHPRLALRRMHLEQSGELKAVKSSKRTSRSNVLNLSKEKAKRARDVS